MIQPSEFISSKHLPPREIVANAGATISITCFHTATLIWCYARPRSLSSNVNINTAYRARDII